MKVGGYAKRILLALVSVLILFVFVATHQVMRTNSHTTNVSCASSCNSFTQPHFIQRNEIQNEDDEPMPPQPAWMLLSQVAIILFGLALVIKAYKFTREKQFLLFAQLRF